MRTILPKGYSLYRTVSTYCQSSFAQVSLWMRTNLALTRHLHSGQFAMSMVETALFYLIDQYSGRRVQREVEINRCSFDLTFQHAAHDQREKALGHGMV